MNKASVHVTQPGDTTGLGNLLGQTAAAGNPIPIIYAVNANLKSDVQKYSPTTKLVYRRQSPTFERLPGDFFVGDPVNSATTWMTKSQDKADQNRTLIQNWALNLADYYDSTNEPVIQLPPNYTDADLQDAIRKAKWLNTWMITALNIARTNGFKLAMFSFPTGTPPLSMWTYLFPALRLGKQNGAVLSLHEYSVEGTLQNPKPGNILRYRDVWNLLPEDCRVPIIISECGAGNGYDTSLHGQAWANDLIWYNGQTCQDDYLLGFCAYQLGGGESNMVSTLPAYTTAISNFKCPIPVPVEPPDPHEPPLPPPVKPPVPIPTEESLNGDTVPPSTQILDNNLHVWKFGAPVPMGYVILRDNIQFAGGQGNLLLYWNHVVYTTNANGEWYRADATWTRISGDPRLPATVEGLDVSHYQGTVSWLSVKSQKKFSFVKATEGSNIIDSTFGINWANAKGLPRGAYHFYRFANPPTDQAALFIGALNKDYGELPLVVDLEDEVTPVNFNDLKTFVDLVQNTTKRRVMIYTAEWWRAKYNLTFPAWMTAMDLWVASYTSAPALPKGYTSYRFWQYSSTGAVNGISGNVDLDRFNGTVTDFQNYLNTVAYTPPTPPPTITMKAGVGVGNLYPFTTQELDAIQLGKCETVLLMTMPDYAQMRQQVQKLRTKIPGIDIVGRLFFPEDGAPYTPQQALAYCRNGLQGMYDEGIREFQIGNEVNIAPGGMGWNWQNGTQFAAWFDLELSLLKSQFPGCRWGYPALSPQSNTVQFFTDSKSVADKCDWVGVHSYFWTWSGGAYNAIDESGGFSWKSIARLTSKPLYLTEYSCNTSAVSYADKGIMYKNYLALLKNDGRISRAHSFALSWGYQDTNKEAWVIGDARNQITDIPKTISS